MARVKDLWHSEVEDPDDPGGKRKIKRKTARHPDRGGSKDAKRWLAVWIAPDGKEKTKAFHLRDKATRHARKMEEDAERGEYIDPDAGKELFGPLAKKWLRLQAVGASSARKYEGSYRLHIEATFGHRRVGSIKPSEVLEWLRALEKTHGLSTQEMAYMVLMGVFALAVADKHRKDNPADSPIIPKPRKEPKERDPWAVDLVWRVIEGHPAPYRAIPIASAGCGLRQGEAFALAEGDFDFEDGKLLVRRQVIRIGKLIVFKLPKGGKERTVPLSPGTAREIQAHMAVYPPAEVALPWMQENGQLAEAELRAKLVFLWHGGTRRTHGKCLQTSSYNDFVWKPALAKAEVIPTPETGPRGGTARYASVRENGTHNLRHHFSTTLLDAGVSLAGVMDFMGHSKRGAPVTLGVYGHVTEETYESARSAIDRSLFRLRPVQDQSADGTVAELAAQR